MRRERFKAKHSLPRGNVASRISLLSHFACLLLRPKTGINRILADKPSFRRIIFFLFVVATFRGLLECAWVLLGAGQFGQVLTSSTILLKSYLRMAIPFLISSITCGYVRWVGFALAVYLLASFFGKKGRFDDCLRVSGVALGIYLVTIILNFAYLLFPLPAIEFAASPYYKPTIGIGQVVTSAWLIFVMYSAARLIFRLPRYASFLIGLSVVLINLGALVLACVVFFNLPPLTLLSFRDALGLGTLLFVVVTLLCTAGFYWLGVWHEKRETLSRTGDIRPVATNDGAAPAAM